MILGIFFFVKDYSNIASHISSFSDVFAYPTSWFYSINGLLRQVHTLVFFYNKYLVFVYICRFVAFSMIVCQSSFVHNLLQTHHLLCHLLKCYKFSQEWSMDCFLSKSQTPNSLPWQLKGELLSATTRLRA